MLPFAYLFFHYFFLSLSLGVLVFRFLSHIHSATCSVTERFHRYGNATRKHTQQMGIFTHFIYVFSTLYVHYVLKFYLQITDVGRRRFSNFEAKASSYCCFMYSIQSNEQLWLCIVMSLYVFSALFSFALFIVFLFCLLTLTHILNTFESVRLDQPVGKHYSGIKYQT